MLTTDCMMSLFLLNTSIGSSTLLSSCLAHDTTPATGGAFLDSGGDPCNKGNTIILQQNISVIHNSPSSHFWTLSNAWPPICTLCFSYVAWISSSSREYLLKAVSIHLCSASLRAARCETHSNLEIMSKALFDVPISVNTACRGGHIFINCIVQCFKHNIDAHNACF